MPGAERCTAARSGDPTSPALDVSATTFGLATPAPPHAPLGDLRMGTDRPLRVHLVIGECEHVRYLVHGLRASFLRLHADAVAREMSSCRYPSGCAHGCRLTYRAVELGEVAPILGVGSVLVEHDGPYRVAGCQLAPEIRGPLGPVNIPCNRLEQTRAIVRELNAAWWGARRLATPGAGDGSEVRS